MAKWRKSQHEQYIRTCGVGKSERKRDTLSVMFFKFEHTHIHTYCSDKCSFTLSHLLFMFSALARKCNRQNVEALKGTMHYKASLLRLHALCKDSLSTCNQQDTLCCALSLSATLTCTHARTHTLNNTLTGRWYLAFCFKI